MTDVVANLLNSKGISYTPSGKDYLIRCLNPEHDDNNPSCRVDRVTGVTHCFSCGWKRNLFRHFGILTAGSSIRVAKIKEKLQELRDFGVGVDLPDGATPYSQKYRNISPQTYRRFEAFTTDRVEKLQDRIVFPIKEVTGKIVAFIGRHSLSEGNPRYLVHPSGRPLPLYPCLLDDHNNSMVLVEGIFDMLNLQDKGLTNAVCTFGTSTISEDNVSAKMLPYKVQGIRKVHILYDGDQAGRDAAKKLKPILESQDFEVNIIPMEDDSDPGVLSQEDVTAIKEYISNENRSD